MSIPLGTARLTLAERQRARRVFEESIAKVQAQYAPVTDFLVEARVEGGDGLPVVVARYLLYTDGRVECFEVLDDVLWPAV